MNPGHTFTIYFNIILSSTRRSSAWSIPYRFFDKNFIWISPLFSACLMLRPS